MKPKIYEDFGLTKEEFLELVDFFRELMRLDAMPRPNNHRQRLIRVLKNRVAQLKEQKRNELLQQLKRLENL